jgi:hypothetical protein
MHATFTSNLIFIRRTQFFVLVIFERIFQALARAFEEALVKLWQGIGVEAPPHPAQRANIWRDAGSGGGGTDSNGEDTPNSAAIRGGDHSGREDDISASAGINAQTKGGKS